MQDFDRNLEPHALSEVLTGAMFDILKGVFAKQRENNGKDDSSVSKKNKSDLAALAATVPLMQTIAIQPLDLLPPAR
jgi:hypothetical protein